ncbi:MAG: DEAD/DEAH box helicase [Terriglobales bacterium]
MPDQIRPKFKQVKSASPTHATPEDLFYKLSGRSSTHGYLRGPQQDVLREYAEKHTTSSNVAFELPTGTGKTTVGLLIAEWTRSSGSKTAYLSLTNQLAGQVLAEGSRLGISCADLRGTKDTRSVSEEGRYRTAAALAVSTYSNLFNINPVLQDCDAIIFDDAHGAEQYVADMWTVSASASKEADLYNSLLSALQPGLSESQVRSILDKSSSTVELADICGHPECIEGVIAVLDQATAGTARFAWKLIRSRIHSCLFLVSSFDVSIRPLVPPTHTHPPFASAKQRIYMSATLGGESDLQRAYGVEKLEMIRAKSSQWGRRYVFVPGVYVGATDAEQIVARLWDGMKTRRAVLLAPSERIMNRTFESLESSMQSKPARLGAVDIANTVDGFVQNTDVFLTLAGRYDGLDLPDEQCRLLVLSESPAAINPFERHLSERWKMGPVLRKRERTRLIQGMGRCTRNATDFAIIVWLGQSLVNAATSSALMKGFPPELAAEINWGVEQSELAAKTPDQLISMMLALIGDAKYRKEADAAIGAIQAKHKEEQPKDYEEAGKDEVRYAKAMWDDNYTSAYETARGIADHLTSAELAGYRAWWWYLASIAASFMQDVGAEQDCLERASKCGVNSGWLNRLRQQRNKAAKPETSKGTEPNAEGLWDLLSNWGWAGPAFEQKLAKMIDQLKDTYHVSYHEGLDALGKCYGATTTRSTESGAPDVVWSFTTDLHLAFEAKTEKKPAGVLSKKDVQEAKGHADWIQTHLSDNAETAEIATVVVAPSPSLHQIALPFAGGLFYVDPQSVLKIADKAAENLRKLRVKFSGRDYAQAAVEFSTAMRNGGLDLASVRKAFLSEPLKK